MSIIRAMREESETIKFDNLFTNDLEREQEFDLIFTAEQDDEDLKSVAGDSLIKENGEEVEGEEIEDFLAVNEDGEIVDKNEEAEAESDEPVEDIGTADEEDITDEKPEAPGIVVNIDADDVNINAASEEKVSESDESGNVGMTINATTVNMSVAAGDIENESEEKEEEVPPTVEPAAPEVPSEPEADTAEPITPIDTEDTFDDEEDTEPASTENDTTEVETDTVEVETDDDNEPTATAESVDLNISLFEDADELEDQINDGLEPAPAPEETSMENEPVDPSTEVVFSDTGDQEVQESTILDEAAEPTKDPITPIEEEFLFEEDVVDVQDAKPIGAKEIEQNTDISPIGPDEIIPDEVNVPAEDQDYDKEAEMKHEAAEPTKDPITPIEEEADFDDPTEGAPADNGLKAPMSDDPKHRDTSSLSAIAGTNTDEVEDAAETVDDLAIAKVDSMYEAAEPTKDPIKPIDEEFSDLLFEEELSAVKNDIHLEPAKKIEAEFEDDMKDVTDANVEKLLNNAPEDETKEEYHIDPIKPEDLPMYDGSVKEASEPMDPTEEYVEQDAEDSLLAIEPSLTAGDLAQMYEDKDDDPDKVNDGKLAEAAEPTKDPITPIEEEADFMDNLEDNVEDQDKVEDALNDVSEDEVKDELDIDPVEPEDIPGSKDNLEEAAEPTKDPIKPIEEEADFMDQVNAMDNGEGFADVMNMGLDVSPEEVEPGSIDELIDDEACEIVENM